MPPKPKIKNKEKDDEKLNERFKPVKKTIKRRAAEYKDTHTEGKKEDEENNKYKVDITTAQETLKHFDLDINYGPIIGIYRTDRLRRAEYFNIPLASEVKRILHDKILLKKYPELDLNIWHDIDHHTYVAINKY